MTKQTIKVLVFRRKDTGKIICVHQYSQCDNLQDVINTYNETDEATTVEQVELLPNSIEAYLYNMQKTNNVEELKECVRYLDLAMTRLQITATGLKTQLEEMKNLCNIIN